MGSTPSSTQGTSPTIGQFFMSLKTLISRPTLTLFVFLNQKSFSTDKAALPPGGERTSLELLETTRLFSRKSTCQLLAMTSVRPLSEPPGLARDSSLTTPSSVLVELMARTLAREMEAVPWSARASLTQLLTSRLALWLGVLDVAKTTHRVSMLLRPRVSAGLTML